MRMFSPSQSEAEATTFMASEAVPLELAALTPPPVARVPVAPLTQAAPVSRVPPLVATPV